MNYTKGEWKVSPVNFHVFLPNVGAVADCFENETNARLIAAAVNACQSVNPDNPLAVADNIKEMYEALKRIASCKSIVPGDVVDIARKVLAKAEGKS